MSERKGKFPFRVWQRANQQAQYIYLTLTSRELYWTWGAGGREAMAGTRTTLPVLLIPHAAAGLMGFTFVKLLNKGVDLGAWMNKLARNITALFIPKKKQENSIKHTAFYDQGKKEPFTKKVNLTQQRIDNILDKINQQGYEKLTDEEKKILNRASKEDI